MRTVVPLVFIALAAWFVAGQGPMDLPILPAADVTLGPLPAPLRPLPELPLRADIEGTHLTCGECHRIFESRPDPQQALLQHTHIQLDHGLNDRCLNCHARADHDKLELRDGELVGFDEIPRLCSQCHGPTFRDWERGMHGRTDGAWDRDLGTQRQLGCSECHDPHAPAFPRLVPLPGPRTLRMGTPPAHAPEPRGPLMRSHSADAPSAEHPDG